MKFWKRQARTCIGARDCLSKASVAGKKRKEQIGEGSKATLGKK